MTVLDDFAENQNSKDKDKTLRIDFTIISKFVLPCQIFLSVDMHFFYDNDDGFCVDLTCR